MEPLENNASKVDAQQLLDAQQQLLHAQQVHADAVVIDAHADIVVPGYPAPYVGLDGRSRVAPDKLEAGGVDAVVLALASPPGQRSAAGYASARRLADRQLATVHDMVSDPATQSRIVTTADELNQTRSDGLRAIILGFQNALIVGTDVSTFGEFYEAGVRMFALNHIGHNDYADSSRPNYLAEFSRHEPDEEHGGLSPLGVQAIEYINGLGALLDVSQLSRNATLQALEVASGPVIASHSNVRALCDVSRNLSDEEVDAIAASGGVICLSPFVGYLYDTTNEVLLEAILDARRRVGLPDKYLYPFELYWELDDPDAQLSFREEVRALLSSVKVSAMVDHIDFVVQRVGIDHVGFGSDFNHGGGLPDFYEASDALNLTAELVRRGYAAPGISAILGGNFLRLLGAGS